MTSITLLLAARNEGLLDRLGLGSLEDIPWEAFPMALGLSALIGAAGGMIFAGLLGPGNERKKRKP